VRLGFQGLTGAAYLEADYVDAQSNTPLEINWKPKYTYIPSTQSTITRISETVENIMKNLEKADFKEVATKLETALTAATRALQGVNMGKVGEQAENLLAEVRQTNHRLIQILKEPEIASILSDTSATMAAARQILESSEKPMQELISRLTSAASSLENLSRNLDRMSKDIPNDMKKLKNIVDCLHNLVSSQQANIETSIENLKAFTDDLQEMGDNIKRYPSLILLGDPPKPSNPGSKR
jgi:ABC-type transporter Mla subunit MlaD